MRYKIEFDLPDSKTVLENIDSTYAFWSVWTWGGYARVVPVDAERKTGKWIISNTNSKVTTYKCSECGRIVHDETGYDVSKDYPYCHCGADMRGEQE